MNRYAAAFVFAFTVSYASVAQVRDIDIRLAGSALLKPVQIADNTYRMENYGAGVGADVWLSRQLAIGASHFRKIEGWVYFDGDYSEDRPLDGDLSGVDFLMTEFHIKWSTPRYKRFSFYAGPAFSTMQYYYEKLNYGVATAGIGATVGCNVNLTEWLKLNLFEANAIAPAKNIIGGEGKRQFYQATAGLVFQVNRSK